jgi:hypothetical protein
MHPYRVLIGVGVLAVVAAILSGCFVKKARPHVLFLAFLPAHLTLSVLSLPHGVGVLMAYASGGSIAGSNLSAGEFFLGLVCATLHLPLTIPLFFVVGSSVVFAFLWVIPLNSLTAGLILASILARWARQCASPAEVQPCTEVGSAPEESQNEWIARRVCELEARDSAKRGGSAPKE